MTEWVKNNKLYFFIGLFILAAIALYYFMPNFAENEKNRAEEWDEFTDEEMFQEESVKEIEEEETETVLIDVKGAVVHPGVYEAEAGERVIDLIESAGGLLDNADKNQINFAMKVTDEMVLYIPSIGEDIVSGSNGATSMAASFASTSDDGKVNINTASQSELETLTGIGPSKAAAIIEYRETNGPFKEIEQLMEISGIGEKTFSKLKEEITVR